MKPILIFNSGDYNALKITGNDRRFVFDIEARGMRDTVALEKRTQSMLDILDPSVFIVQPFSPSGVRQGPEIAPGKAEAKRARKEQLLRNRGRK